MDGKIVIDETNYNSVVYKNDITLDDERRSLLKEISDMEGDIEKKKAAIEKYVREEFTPHKLPARFKVRSIDIKSKSVEVTWHAEGALKIERIKKDTSNDPFKEPEKKEDDVYKALADRYDFKQILNSGVLTKDEKRKCLGLPALSEPQKKEDK